MSPALTFHVPPDAGPAGMRALLMALASCSDGEIARVALLERMIPFIAGDARPRGEVITLAHDLGIIEANGSGLVPTARTTALRTTQSLVDLIHGLQYFAWSSNEPRSLSRLWTYRTVVDALWDESPVTLSAATKRRMVEHVLSSAEHTFASVPGFDPRRTSVGPKTIDGVVSWLRDLSPSVVQDGVVRRRQTCPPPLVVIALSEVIRSTGAVAGTDFRLAPEQRDTLCRSCFLDAGSLDRMLDWTVSTQPKLLRWGTLISTYGRQIVLARTDIAPENLV